MTSQLTTFPDDVLAMAKRVAGLADIYWAPECFPKEFAEARQSWLAALIQFVASYSFERQGAPPIYRTYARKALEKHGNGLARPNSTFVKAAWNEFHRFASANAHGTNPNVCSLHSGKGYKLTAIEFAIELSAHGHNIFAWASDLLARGKAEEAERGLLRIRGIGHKIATFYLRDVVRAAGLDETRAGPGWCFQPVDVWVRRAAEVWGSLSRVSVTNYWTAAELIVDLAGAAGVVGGDLNGGVWILGSQLVDRNADPDLSETLASSVKLETCLNANLGWSRAIIDAIEERSPL